MNAAIHSLCSIGHLKLYKEAKGALRLTRVVGSFCQKMTKPRPQPTWTLNMMTLEVCSWDDHGQIHRLIDTFIPMTPPHNQLVFSNNEKVDYQLSIYLIL